MRFVTRRGGRLAAATLVAAAGVLASWLADLCRAAGDSGSSDAAVYRAAARLSYQRRDYALAERESRRCLEMDPSDAQCAAVLTLVKGSDFDLGVREAASSRRSATIYRLDFEDNSVRLSMEGKRRLAQLAEAMLYYPLEDLRLTGYAAPGEDRAPALARDRAKYVARLLEGTYGIEARRIREQPKAAESARAEVEVHIVSLAQTSAAVRSRNDKAKIAGETAAGGRQSAVQHWNSGIIYFQQGDAQKAREEWMLCRRIDPANSDCASGLDRLRPAGP